MVPGSDLPANFSDQYSFAYGQNETDKYPVLVGTKMYGLNTALVDRFYKFEQGTSNLQTLRSTYTYILCRSESTFPLQMRRRCFWYLLSTGMEMSQAKT